MIITISSFNEIILTKEKTLVLCDIDDTVLYWPNCKNECQKILGNCYNGYNCKENKEEFEMDYLDLISMYKSIHNPVHTDFNEFVSMLNKLQNQNSKLTFLTARHKDYSKGTNRHLTQIGLSCDDFEIHYAGTNMTKGEYIQNYINLTEWDDIIFIDDSENNINSVINLHPQIRCYKFVI